MFTGRWALCLILATANAFATQFGTIPFTQVLGTPSIVNDANVTLTLSGTPTDSLLHPVTFTLGWTGALSTARGGIPTGGTIGQVLAKNSNTIYDVGWITPASGGGGGNVSNSGTPTVGQIAVWTDATHIMGLTENLSGGTINQVLTKNSSTSYDWSWVTPANALQWDGGATSLVAATGRTSLGLVIGTNVAPATSGGSILYGNGSGGFSNVTVGTGLSFTTGTLTATSSGGVTSITATSPIVVAPTPLTSTGVVSLNAAVDLGLTVAQTETLTDAITSVVSDVLTVNHNSTGAPAANYGTGILFKGKSDTTNGRIMGEVSAAWYVATDGSRASFMQLTPAAATGLSIGETLKFFTSGYLTNSSSPTDPGVALCDFSNGYRAVGVTPVTGRFLQSDGTSYTNSGYALPTTVGTGGKILQWSGSNVVSSTPTWPATAGAAGNVPRSDGTNFVSAALTPSDVGAQPLDSDLTTWAAITRAAGVDTFVTTPSSANLLALITDETGTGKAVFASSPTLVTPDITTGFTIGTAAASGKIPIGNGTNYVPSTPAYPNSPGTAGYHMKSDGTNFAAYPDSISNSATAAQNPSTADISVGGSAVAVAAGDFKAKGQYHCIFDMTKSAGTGAIVITLRVGVNGTNADASIQTYTFGAGTSVADTGTFEVFATFRSVGSGTAAVIQGFCRAAHNLTTTGLISNADQFTVIGSPSPSSGFNSSTATNISLSFNGGTAFAGTSQVVQATLEQP